MFFIIFVYEMIKSYSLISFNDWCHNNMQFLIHGAL